MTGIKKVARWQTEDGALHTTPEMAEQYLLNAEMIEWISPNLEGRDAQDILNLLSGNRKKLRAWLDACDAMERASLQ